MTKKVIMAKGLPSSGKSTWAKSVLDKYPNQYKRVNKDLLREMLDNSLYGKSNEAFILEMRDMIIDAALKGGKHVIVDDTGLDPKHEKRLREIAKEHNANFEIKDFTDVGVDECIRRDLLRPRSVGEKVIRDMYNRYLNPKSQSKVHEYIEIIPGLPRAIIVDIDGTLAMMKNNGRKPYDWERVDEDLPHTPVIQLLDNYVYGYNDTHLFEIRVIIVSGRDESCRQKTEDWLSSQKINYSDLFMRPANDNRKDVIIKREIYEDRIKDKYNVMFVLDDRDVVVTECWRALGLPCFQVAPGAF